ncbi:MAG TPA: secretin N-terminal domain-containing protein [Vicinamibacterales bacterium]|nr:secretin N-terminal domain-containing protein [Vicinamibacterales bacterium]
MAHITKRLAAPLALTIALAACATTGSLRSGERAEQAQDYDRAVAEYTSALKRHPDDRTLLLVLQRVKLRAAQDHVARARRLEATGKLDEALVEYQIAAEMNPSSGDIDAALRNIRTQLRTKVVVAREGKTELETLIDHSQNLGPPGLDLPSDVRLPASLVFRDASVRDVYTVMARFANVNIVFDPTFRDDRITIDLSNVTLDQALAAVSAATRNFYKVTAQRTVAVIPDTAAKRREYEEELVRTFYLSNADLKETIDLLRIVVDARRIAPLTATNALTIKDTPERVNAAARIIQAIDKARPEVVIDVELLEVNRTRLLEYGLQFASPGSAGVNGIVDANRDKLTLQQLINLSQTDIILTNLPALYYRLLKTDANTRTLANPQLRTSEGVVAQARFGEQVPVPITTFAPIATGGVQQQPITSFQYQNIGVNIDITPRTHHDDDVSLALKVVVTAQLGTGFGGLPTFANREITTAIRLRDGETNLLAGLIRDDERMVLEGIPGLSDIPGVGRLFAHNRKETVQTDVVLTLTPHIIRVLDLSEADLRPFRVSNDTNAPLIDLPIIQTPPVTVPPPPIPPVQGAPQPAPPAQSPGQQPQPAQPIPGTLAPAPPQP